LLALIPASTYTGSSIAHPSHQLMKPSEWRDVGFSPKEPTGPMLVAGC
jgi:hypothetical protein